MTMRFLAVFTVLFFGATSTANASPPKLKLHHESLPPGYVVHHVDDPCPSRPHCPTEKGHGRLSLWVTAGVGAIWAPHEGVVPDVSAGIELQFKVNHRLTLAVGAEVAVTLNPVWLEYPLLIAPFIEAKDDEFEVAPVTVMIVFGDGGRNGVRSVVFGPAFTQIVSPGKFEITYSVGAMLTLAPDKKPGLESGADLHALEAVANEESHGSSMSAQSPYGVGVAAFVAVAACGFACKN